MSAPETPSNSDPRAQAHASLIQRRTARPSRRGPTLRPARARTRRARSGRGAGSPSPACSRPARSGSGRIYAINLDSDLDDANARVASQQEQIDQAQDTGGDVVAAAKSAYDDLTAQLGATQDDASQAVEQASEQLDQAEQAAEDAKGTADELQKEADAAQAKAATAATCAQSFLSAFSGVFGGETLKAGVEATVAELQAPQPQCAPALEQG